MRRAPVVILGVPADSFTLEEAVQYAFHLADCHTRDGRPRFACTLGTDILACALGWSPRGQRRPDLLNVIRQADMVLVDSGPVIRASRILGPALKERAAGADLAHRVVREASARGKSVYFLGGGASQNMIDRIRELLPDLRTAGWDVPEVRTGRRKSPDADVREGGAVERINASGADILIAAMGSLREGLWFQRNRHLIRVPVSLGIGRTFHGEHGSAHRGPFGPGSRVRSFAGLLKIEALVRFPTLFHRYAKAVAPHSYLKTCRNDITAKHGTRGDASFILLSLPGSVDTDAVRRIQALVPSKPSAGLIVDFRAVGFIDSAGLGGLLDLILRWDASGHGIAFAGMSAGVRRCLRLNRLHDLVSLREYEDTEKALTSQGVLGGGTRTGG